MTPDPTKETTKELQTKDTRDLATPTEQTRPGPVFSPAVDIFETEDALTLLADMPGVEAKNLKIDLKESVLTLSAAVAPVATTSEEVVLAEYETGNYYRQFALSEAIDQEKIEASLNQGVLKLFLPKVEAIKPRQITVKTT